MRTAIAPAPRAGLLLTAAVGMAVLAGGPFRPAAAADEAVVQRLKGTVETLAAPELQGRGPATDGLKAAGSYILVQMKNAGLKPGGDASDYRQTFEPDARQIRSTDLAPAGGWGGVTFSNVIGVLPGEGGDGRCIVVGAHYDHLGVSPEGEPFRGADDNASGVAVLLEVASRLAAQGPLRRTIVFAAFSGEEEGTLGSIHYLKSPACPLDRTVAMLNLDTVGRMSDHKLLILGTSSAGEWREALRGVNLGFGFDLEMPEAAPFASDQVPFYEKGIPVLHFFTGPNADYHRVSDTPEKINYEALADLAGFVQEVVTWIGDGDEELTFIPPGAAEAAPVVAQGPPRRTSLGGIPDFGRESGGVLLAGTVPGSPAEKAGVQKGDILVSLAGMPVDNLGDYSAALKAHQPGDTVEVVVKRDGSELRFQVELIERK